jgi:hypothetical protein
MIETGIAIAQAKPIPSKSISALGILIADFKYLKVFPKFFLVSWVNYPLKNNYFSLKNIYQTLKSPSIFKENEYKEAL